MSVIVEQWAVFPNPKCIIFGLRHHLAMLQPCIDRVGLICMFSIYCMSVRPERDLCPVAPPEVSYVLFFFPGKTSFLELRV